MAETESASNQIISLALKGTVVLLYCMLLCDA